LAKICRFGAIMISKSAIKMLEIHSFASSACRIYPCKGAIWAVTLRARQENRPEAEVIRELVNKGLTSTHRANRETAGNALLRLAKVGEELQVKAPANLSSRIDEYLYGEN
jgi:hypothetical protein